MAKKRISLIEMPTCPTLNDIAEEYLTDCKSRGLRPASIVSAEQHLRPVLRIVDCSIPITDINFKEVYAKLYDRKDISVNTIAGYLRTVKCLVRYANKTYNLELPTPVVKTEETIKETYTDEELMKLIRKPNKFKSFSEYRNWLMICIFVDTGIRSATMRNIKPGDFDFDRGSLSTRHNKNHHVQEIPISKNVLREVKKFITLRKCTADDYLFCDVYGNQLSANGLKLAIIRYNRARGVELHSVHAFRHTFARKYLLDMDGDALKLQRLLGHSTLAMTKNYCRIYSQDLIDDNKSIFDSLQHHKIKLQKIRVEIFKSLPFVIKQYVFLNFPHLLLKLQHFFLFDIASQPNCYVSLLFSLTVLFCN